MHWKRDVTVDYDIIGHVLVLIVTLVISCYLSTEFSQHTPDLHF